MVKRNQKRQKRRQRRNNNPGVVSINPAPLFRQLQSTHLHKVTTFTYLVSDGSGLIDLNTDLANSFTSAPNYKQLNYVYARYRIEAIHLNIMSLSPIQGPGATQLFIRYAPNVVQNANSPQEITDTVSSKNFDPNKLTLTQWCFKPRFSTSNLYPTGPSSTPDQDGYLPFSTNSLGFVNPFMGCVQYYQDQSGNFGEKTWQITFTYFTRCTYSQ